jgi:hypothetical protein
MALGFSRRTVFCGVCLGKGLFSSRPYKYNFMEASVNLTSKLILLDQKEYHEFVMFLDLLI